MIYRDTEHLTKQNKMEEYRWGSPQLVAAEGDIDGSSTGNITPILLLLVAERGGRASRSLRRGGTTTLW